MKDRYERVIDYMRISITDRCNLRCRYCMENEMDWLPPQQILTYEEILNVVKAATSLGIKKIKITGGEPLVRSDVTKLIASMKAIPEIEQVTLTTNGVLLKQYIPDLLEAGIDGLNVSLDTLRRDRYRRITRFDKLEDVLAGIEMALQVGLKVKLNAVLQRSVNDDEIIDLASLAKEKKLDVRFIELMPIGEGNVMDGVPNKEVLALLESEYGRATTNAVFHGNGPAVYYDFADFRGSVGFISAIHGKFCSSCNRIRMTSQGYIKPCLCYEEGIDLSEILRDAREEKIQRIQTALKNAILMKPGEHVFEEEKKITERKRMVQIGG